MSLKINFIWTNGVKNKDRFDRWNDGLRQALRLIEAEGHEISFHEPDEDLPNADWNLFWEAACSFNADNGVGDAYKKVLSSPIKTALHFAGGPIKREWVEGFDHIFVESKINKDEFDALGIKNSTAFGVNTDIFTPLNLSRPFKTVTHGTCASWKRQWLVAEAMGSDALIFGQPQAVDPKAFDLSRELGANVLLEQSYEKTNELINRAKVGVNCADYWGGGQRTTLELMACGLPVVVMNDSPKNMEYLLESGLGFICNPNAQDIQKAVEQALLLPETERIKNRWYVMSKWTPEHYKDAILNALT